MEIKKVTRVLFDTFNQCIQEIWCENSIVYSAAAPVIESVEPLLGIKVGDYVLLDEHENATTIVYEAVSLGWSENAEGKSTRFQLTDYPGEEEFTIPELKVSKGITVFVVIYNGDWKMLFFSGSAKKVEEKNMLLKRAKKVLSIALPSGAKCKEFQIDGEMFRYDGGPFLDIEENDIVLCSSSGIPIEIVYEAICVIGLSNTVQLLNRPSMRPVRIKYEKDVLFVKDRVFLVKKQYNTHDFEFELLSVKRESISNFEEFVRSRRNKNAEFARQYGASETTIKQIEKQGEVEQILSERGSTHGEFSLNSKISQDLKQIVRRYNNKLTFSQAESLDMILHKIARILAGNPDHVDHWDDIGGYATLVSKELRQCKT